ncbi:FAD/NAD(P)-binding domain-containing protein [Biscogniauxia sp. FL1348]|nr:FAD/NAD(P)-binding domain-containing protein [Biscogniauxia sp. FL1348]
MSSERHRTQERRVAVIGAGVSGLTVARRLLAEGVNVTVYERQPMAGGVWYYTSNKRHAFATPAYKSLETNFPRELMEFSDFPWPSNTSAFPSRQQVHNYIQEYGRDVPVCYNREVVDVYLRTRIHPTDWKIQTRNTTTGKVSEKDFHAIVVATGTYNTPFEPEYSGLAAWKDKYPRSVSHAKTYRKPDKFRGKNVVVVGNSASGWDISLQIAKVAKKVWVSSTRPGQRSHEKIEGVVGIERLVPSERSVDFKDSTTASDVDNIVLCTGYLYGVPFLRKGQKAEGPIWANGFRLDDLYEHIFWTRKPTLMFVGIPKGGPTFLVSQAQSALVARFIACRWGRPCQKDMISWVAEQRVLWNKRREVAPSIENERTFHNLIESKSKDYIERLGRWCTEADEEVPSTASNRNPPFIWTKRLDWVMDNRRSIRDAFLEKGLDRHQFYTPESLGVIEDETTEDIKESSNAGGCQK